MRKKLPDWVDPLELRRYLRSRSTAAERALWQELRANKLGVKFRRQYSIEKFIVDFVCLEKKLVIEVDGPIHQSDEQLRHDRIRSEIIENCGFRIVRFMNNEVMYHREDVLNTIKSMLE